MSKKKNKGGKPACASRSEERLDIPRNPPEYRDNDAKANASHVKGSRA